MARFAGEKRDLLLVDSWTSNKDDYNSTVPEGVGLTKTDHNKMYRYSSTRRCLPFSTL